MMNYNAKSDRFSLKASNLFKQAGTKRIVNDVTIEIKPAETVAILGPNGAGKTTIFHMISGLTKPDMGKVTLDKYDITSENINQRARRGICYLPQENSLFTDLTVYDNLKMFLELAEKNIDKDLTKKGVDIDEILKIFNLSKLAKTKASNLSGGEAKRLEIARAMMSSPKFLLLDEPFAALDPVSIELLNKYFLQLTKRNIGIIITDHNAKETLAIVSRCYIIDKGKIISQGSVETILKDKLVRDVYLGNRDL